MQVGGHRVNGNCTFLPNSAVNLKLGFRKAPLGSSGQQAAGPASTPHPDCCPGSAALCAGSEPPALSLARPSGSGRLISARGGHSRGCQAQAPTWVPLGSDPVFKPSSLKRGRVIASSFKSMFSSEDFRVEATKKEVWVDVYSRLHIVVPTQIQTSFMSTV